MTMPKPELIKRIKDYFNLNIYETKVWLALVSKSIASAGEIAEISGVPRSRTYDVLESLEKNGFAIQKVGKPAKYIAVKPLAVLEKLKTKVMQNADEKLKVLETLKETREYEELESLHNSSIAQVKREEISGAITGRTNILSHAKSLIENADKEVLISMPASELFEKSRLFSSIFEKIKKSNLQLKLALKGTDEEIKKIAEKYSVKPVKTEQDSKFFIIDKKQVLLYLTNKQKEEDEMAVWLNSDFFSSALSSLFENVRR